MFAELKKKRCIDSDENRENLKLYGKYTDKLNAKQIVKSQQIDGLHVAKLLGIYNYYDEIDVDKLPDQFVIKTTHWSGCAKIILDKETFKKTKENNKKHFDSILNQTYRNGLEPHYKYIERRLFVEECLGIQDTEYKFHCIYGKVACILSGNVLKGKMAYFNKDFKQLRVSRYGDMFSIVPTCQPQHLQDMISIAEKLSRGFDYVRIDLYISGDKIYFGEYTFTPSACNQIINDFSFETLLLEFLEKRDVDYDKVDKYLV